MSKQNEPRVMNEEDKKALGEFITTCFNLNDDIEKFLSTWAQYGFETACDYLRTEKIAQLEKELKIACQALEQYKDGKALLIKPEKRHLYQDSTNDTDAFYLRSTSDYTHTLLAEQTLSQISYFKNEQEHCEYSGKKIGE